MHVQYYILDGLLVILLTHTFNSSKVDCILCCSIVISIVFLLYILYRSFPSGKVKITDHALKFSLQSTPIADPPVFTLTCISTGGPATTVTWTRDEGPAAGLKYQSVTDQKNSIYHNTLTVTGRLLGVYQCTVANDRTDQTPAASLNVTGNYESDCVDMHNCVYICDKV